MSLPFRERNPVTIGLVSFAVIILLMLAAFKADQLPLIGGGDTYYANFSDASGIVAGNEVRVAGVRVGKVKSVDLSHGHVRVAFQVQDKLDLGADTAAQIKVKTLLGSMFLALEPAGSGHLQDGATIPQSRTKSAYDIVQAFSGLASRTEKIDLDQLRTSLNTLAGVTENTPEEFQGTLKGLSDLSANIAARDDQLNTLLANAKSVSTVLADRNQDVVKLMKDSDVLLRALVARREAVHRLLVSTSQLSTQLSGLVNDTKTTLKPALDSLQQVTQLLLKNQDNLDSSLRLMAPFYRVFANTLGSGPWFDTYIQNLPPV
ncbi:MCE family protein [Nocardioides mangrovicus]|uniref:MCE family protein n=1 Tax=Nocardioides mangrovicus TaxID=2478913 RepID=A0A3L8P6L6_9ACTN|nr:MCE family protein [Nocardioides mangrovicus]RLV50597.1 MCE family protein [Nocardioides mangrovicus]